MDREDIEWEAEELIARVAGINQWISENPKTDPNMYEMTECLMEFGNICALYKKSVFDEELAKGNKVSEYDIIKMGNLPRLEAQIRQMMKLRGLVPLNKNEEVNSEFALKDANHGFQIVDSEYFSQNKAAADFLKDVHYLAITGGYTGEDVLGKENFKEKKKVFAKIAAINLYVWQESKKDLNFSYDNVGEYKQVKKAFDRLKGTLEEYGVYYYEGGDSIDKMFEEVKQYSKPQMMEEVDNNTHNFSM